MPKDIDAGFRDGTRGTDTPLISLTLSVSEASASSVVTDDAVFIGDEDDRSIQTLHAQDAVLHPWCALHAQDAVLHPWCGNTVEETSSCSEVQNGS